MLIPNKYLLISFLCHIIFVSTLINVEGPSTIKTNQSDVYEVSLVAGSFFGTTNSSGNASGFRDTEIISGKMSQNVSIGAIEKDSPPEISAQLLQTDINSDKTAHIGASQEDSTGGEPSSKVVSWEARVKSSVETIWKAPQELDNVNTSLKTTCIIRVNRAGELLQMKPSLSSENDLFNQSIFIALRKMHDFTPPPLTQPTDEECVWVEVTTEFTPQKVLIVSVNFAQ